jgi:hypothetical protein
VNWDVVKLNWSKAVIFWLCLLQENNKYVAALSLGQALRNQYHVTKSQLLILEERGQHCPALKNE